MKGGHYKRLSLMRQRIKTICQQARDEDKVLSEEKVVSWARDYFEVPKSQVIEALKEFSDPNFIDSADNVSIEELTE